MSTDLSKVNENNYKIYILHLNQIFNQIDYYLSKKNVHFQKIKNNIKEFRTILENENKSNLNADKYFPIIAKSLEYENYKIAYSVLDDLKFLISNNFLLGKTKENDIQSDLETKNNGNRRILDLMIDSFLNLENYSDEEIWFKTLEVFHEIILNKKIILIKENLIKIFKYYFNLYSKTRNNQNKEIEEKIRILINEYYTEMSSSYNKYNIILPLERKDTNFSFDLPFNDFMYKIYNNLGNINFISNNLKNNPLDILISRILKQMVDSICLEDAKGTLTIYNNYKVNSLIPKNENDFTLPLYRKLSNLKIYNEYNNESGYFGWCYICRKKANYYCKDRKVPLCSFKCKEILNNEDETIFNFQKGLLYNENCIEIFKFLSSILSNESYNLKLKKLSLELIISIIMNFNPSLINNKKFIQIIRDNLSEGLFKTCLSEYMDIFELSVNLFFLLWTYFREYLKNQIGIFNQNVFLKILESENSYYQQKKIILENFSKREGIYFIELYANYDCEEDEKLLVNRIITALTYIVQGKYMKIPNSYSESENLELISLSLKILTNVIESISNYCEEHLSKRDKNILNDNGEEEGEKLEDFGTTTETNSIMTSQNDFLTKEKIDLNLRKKFQLEEAAKEFNLKPKRGINYLKKHQYINSSTIEQEAISISDFLRNNPNLNKQKIGEFLGEKNDLSLKTLKYFAESFNFKGMKIVSAIRFFLSAFQLPGEGQKIDRILQNFSAKYYNDNNNIFESADATFYLTYAIMILQTELHNPNIKEKMTLESFTKFVNDQNNKPLDNETLKDIYNDILNEPISLPELDEAKDKLKNNKKEENYKKERQRIINEINMKLKQNNEKPYFKVLDKEEFLESFMENIWTPLLVMYGVIIEASDNPKLYTPCIYGLSNCIKIFGIMDLDSQQKITLMTSFSNLTNIFYIKQIEEKNILCIKQILHLASSDCRYCKYTWNIILDIINKIYFYHLSVIGSKLEKEEIFKNLSEKKKNNPNFEEQLQIEKENMKLITKSIPSNDYERIFPRTKNFDQISIMDFVQSLCEIAKKQFKNGQVTKIFFLQKVVEVAEANVKRNRYIWRNIWNLIGNFLTEVALENNTDNSITSINSIRQLAMIYLPKEENSEFHFQTEFLKPFQEIWEKSNNDSIKEYIIVCLNNIVGNLSQCIKSGWIIILNIFSSIANENNINDNKNKYNNNNNDSNNNNNDSNNNNNINDNKNEMIKQTFDTLYDISKNHFNDIVEILPNFLQCIGKYSSIRPKEVNKILEIFKNKIQKKEHFQILLSSFSIFITNNNEEIRNLGLNNMFKTLDYGLKNINGIKDYEDFWNFLIIKLLIPIIEDLEKKSMKMKDEEIEESKFPQILSDVEVKTASLFDDYFEYNKNYFNNFLLTLTKVILEEKSSVCYSGLECLRFMIGSNRMNDINYLDSIIKLNTSLIHKSLQNDFFTLDENKIEDPNYQEKYNSIITRMSVYSYIQASIISIIEELKDKYLPLISKENIILILECLDESIKVSYHFNCKIKLRMLISQKDNLKVTKGLFKQLKAIIIYFDILNKLNNEDSSNENKQFCFQKIMEASSKILHWFVERNQDYFDFVKNLNDQSINEEITNEKEKNVLELAPFVENSIFPSIIKFEFYKDKKYKDIITNYLFELIMCELPEIREKVKDILSIIFNQNKLKK